MNFISQDHTARSEYIQDRMTAAAELVNNNPFVKMAVGPDVVADVNELAANFFVPNRHNGTIVLTEKQKHSGGFAVVAAENDEPIRLGSDFARFTDEQKVNIMACLGEAGLSEKQAREALRNLKRSLRNQFQGRCTEINLKENKALAIFATLNHPLNPTVLGKAAIARPSGLLVLRMPSRPVNFEEVSDDTIIHEDHHRTQLLRRPLLLLPNIPNSHEIVTLSEEYDAFSRQARVLHAKRLSGILLTNHDLVMLEVPAMIRSIQAEVIGTEVNPIPLLRIRVQDRRNELDLRCY